MKLIDYNSETQEMVIYSSADGSPLLELKSVEFTEVHALNKAFREAERLAGKKVHDELVEDLLGCVGSKVGGKGQK